MCLICVLGEVVECGFHHGLAFSGGDFEVDSFSLVLDIDLWDSRGLQPGEHGLSGRVSKLDESSDFFVVEILAAALMVWYVLRLGRVSFQRNRGLACGLRF